MMTKEAVLGNGEADWWENPPPDLWPIIAANADLTLADMDPLGSMGCLRFNCLLPPFDNVKMRQAVLAVISQADIMTAYAGDLKNWKICPSIFTCGTAMANDAGSAALTGRRDFTKAKQLIAEAGYKGEKIVVMDAVDQPLNHAEASVTADVLKKLGLNVELQAMDWGTLVTRRAKRTRLTRAAGTSSAPAGSAPTAWTRSSTCRSIQVATRRGSAGQRTTRSRHCARYG